MSYIFYEKIFRFANPFRSNHILCFFANNSAGFGNLCVGRIRLSRSEKNNLARFLTRSLIKNAFHLHLVTRSLILYHASKHEYPSQCCLRYPITHKATSYRVVMQVVDRSQIHSLIDNWMSFDFDHFWLQSNRHINTR